MKDLKLDTDIYNETVNYFLALNLLRKYKAEIENIKRLSRAQIARLDYINDKIEELEKKLLIK